MESHQSIPDTRIASTHNHQPLIHQSECSILHKPTSCQLPTHMYCSFTSSSSIACRGVTDTTQESNRLYVRQKQSKKTREKDHHSSQLPTKRERRFVIHKAQEELQRETLRGERFNVDSR